MRITLAELAQRVHTGRLKIADWNWCVGTNSVWIDGKYVPRACIYVMGTGAGQCEAEVVLEEGRTLEEAKTLVHETFGVERVLVGVG